MKEKQSLFVITLLAVAAIIIGMWFDYSINVQEEAVENILPTQSITTLNDQTSFVLPASPMSPVSPLPSQDHEVEEIRPSFQGRIVFHSERNGNFDIYVMNEEAENVVRLTDHPARDIEPSWSPDGSKIAFASARDNINNLELYVMKSDGISNIANLICLICTKACDCR